MNVCNTDLCCEFEESENQNNVTIIRCKVNNEREVQFFFIFLKRNSNWLDSLCLYT